jgi:hypothetical protein
MDSVGIVTFLTTDSARASAPRVGGFPTDRRTGAHPVDRARVGAWGIDGVNG